MLLSPLRSGDSWVAAIAVKEEISTNMAPSYLLNCAANEIASEGVCMACDTEQVGVNGTCVSCPDYYAEGFYNPINSTDLWG